MKLTITTLVIVEGSYIQGIFHSSEEECMNQLTGPIPMTKKHSKNNYSDNAKRKNNHLKQRTYENNKSFIKNHNQSEW